MAFLHAEVWSNFPNMVEKLGYKIILSISLSVIIKLFTKLGRYCLSNKTKLHTSFIYPTISTTEIGLLYRYELLIHRNSGKMFPKFSLSEYNPKFYSVFYRQDMLFRTNSSYVFQGYLLTFQWFIYLFISTL
jgi:hypothetical protein